MEERVYEAVRYSMERSRRYRIRRRRQLQRRCLMGVFTLLLILVLAVSYSALRSQARAEDDGERYKYYTSIEIGYGETLWEIAETYAGPEYASLESYIYEVMEINHLKEEKITAGEYLIVPYFSGEWK